jgi:hypothetical protein
VNKSLDTVNMLATGGVLPSPEAAPDEERYVIPSFGDSETSYAALSGGELLRSRGHGIDLPHLPAASSRGALGAARAALSLIDPEIGDERPFWVWAGDGQGGLGTTQKQITAHLRATSQRCNIWVDDASFDGASADSTDGKLRLDQIEALAGKFDDIYRYTTAIFGYEQGGGLPADDPKYGGVDGDPKIQILMQDICYDFPTIDLINGYFGSNESASQDVLDAAGVNYYTNLAEIFYLDAPTVDADPDYALSVLAHEFQHMIYANEKHIQKGLDKDGTDDWYNEMLSLLAEDLISPLIGITPENLPIQFRIPAFLGTYRYGLYKLPEDTFYPYGNLYAFGAYLVRNFGGVDLLLEMAHNDYTGHASISAALNKLNPGMDFEKALSRYGEALLYSGSRIPAGAATFDKTVSKTIGSTTYTFAGFDIWKVGISYLGPDLRPGYHGPLVLNQRAMDYTKNNIYPHALALQSQNDWQRVSGTLTIELQKPANPAIELSVMVR